MTSPCDRYSVNGFRRNKPPVITSACTSTAFTSTGARDRVWRTNLQVTCYCVVTCFTHCQHVAGNLCTSGCWNPLLHKKRNCVRCNIIIEFDAKYLKKLSKYQCAKATQAKYERRLPQVLILVEKIKICMPMACCTAGGFCPALFRKTE